ncbi:hypothetical protein [Bacillus cereus group sp. BfR-BA-01380]|uniref:hypothetical protein n=1 Tax=Bacillus cereus group sp. BfR-BA-01380 TaxID=2920324 RepID=UPI001F5A6DA6|nr:hypothetical protein [Bacillus cereus group sp. BfR-BA-01380]
MRNVKYPDKTEEVYAIADTGTKVKTFVLWREVLMAYVGPAMMAGIGGLITGSKNLQIAALTTIGGISAIVALILGLWLERRGIHNQWLIGVNHLVVMVVFTLIGAAIGIFAAWMTTFLMEVFGPFNHFVWLNRVWIDFPLSAVIASATITWRWRRNLKKIFHSKENRR